MCNDHRELNMNREAELIESEVLVYDWITASLHWSRDSQDVLQGRTRIGCALEGSKARFSFRPEISSDHLYAASHQYPIEQRHLGAIVFPADTTLKPIAKITYGTGRCRAAGHQAWWTLRRKRKETIMLRWCLADRWWAFVNQELIRNSNQGLLAARIQCWSCSGHRLPWIILL